MKVIVIGCTHAGIAAVRQILKSYPTSEITVYERHATISFLSCTAYLHIGGDVPNLDQAFYTTSAEFTQQGVKMRTQYDVIQVNAKKHEILVQDLQTKEFHHDHYDKLVMATGSMTSLPVIPGIENAKIMLCKTCEQTEQLAKAAQHSPRVAIIGGGYSGVELAAGFQKSGHQVTLIEKKATVLSEYLEPEAAQTVSDLLTEQGIAVHCGTKVTRFSDAGEQLKIETTTAGYVVDLAVICPGMLPQTDLLTGQVEQAVNGALITDEYMHTSDPDILAAGDVTEVHFNPTQGRKYVPLASHAIRQGQLVGLNLVSNQFKSLGSQATTGMQIFGQTIVATGLTLATAQAAGFNARTAFYQGDYRPAFMPTTAKVAITLVYDQTSRRILGAQLISPHEVSQSANVVSVMIQNRNTIDEMAFVDMVFSPNFDEPFNYLNLAAQQAVEQEHGFRPRH